MNQAWEMIMKSFLMMCAAILCSSVPAWSACQNVKLQEPEAFAGISDLAWSPTNKFIAGAKTIQGQIYLWNSRTGNRAESVKSSI